MSVLIRDMEMPKKCGECAIYVRYRTWNDDPGDEFCGMTKENVSYKTKPDWCPLSEVPEQSRIEKELHGLTPEQQYSFLRELMYEKAVGWNCTALYVIAWLKGEED